MPLYNDLTLSISVSLRYGYGLMDADEMVKLAERWTTVPQQHICTSDVVMLNQ